MIVLAGLVGTLLVTRGLTDLFPTMNGTFGTLIVIVLAARIAFQGGIFGRRKAAAEAAPAVKDDGTSTPHSNKVSTSDA